MNRVVREEGDVLLQYYPARGYPPRANIVVTVDGQVSNTVTLNFK